MKLLNVSGSNVVFVGFSVFSFVLLALNIRDEKYSTKSFHALIALLFFTALLVVTCGKTGLFFSALMIVAMKDVNTEKIYKVLLLIGIIAFIIACFMSKGGEATRYINGEWASLTKYSNLLFVSYAAVVALYLLTKRNVIRLKHVIGIAIASYAMFLYGGSRTGFLSLTVLVVFLFILRMRLVRNNNLVYWGCILAPTICMLFCLFTAWGYGKYEFLDTLDMMQQGRVSLNSYYFTHYDLTLFGQHLIEQTTNSNKEFLNLDSAYVDMIMGEGLVFSVFWCIVSGAVIRWFYRRKCFVEVAIMMMYTAYGIAETFLPNCFLNMSLFLYGEYFYNGLYPKQNLSINNKEI